MTLRTTPHPQRFADMCLMVHSLRSRSCGCKHWTWELILDNTSKEGESEPGEGRQAIKGYHRLYLYLPLLKDAPRVRECLGPGQSKLFREKPQASDGTSAQAERWKGWPWKSVGVYSYGKAPYSVVRAQTAYLQHQRKLNVSKLTEIDFKWKVAQMRN